MTAGRRVAFVSCLMASALVSGCSSEDGSINRSARTARSWTATVRTTSEALAGGAVPRIYAAQVLREALEAKRRLAGQPEWRSLPRESRDQLEDAVRELASALDQQPAPSPRS